MPQDKNVHDLTIKHDPCWLQRCCIPMWDEAMGWSVRWDGAVVPCTRVESLSLTQLLILLTIRRNLEVKTGSRVGAICPKVGSVPPQEELNKCNFGGYWGISRKLAYSSGVPWWKWGENSWICDLSLLVLSLGPSWPSPNTLHFTIALQIQTRSSLMFFHLQAGAAQ